MALVSCNKGQESKAEDKAAKEDTTNPFYTEWTTPFGAAPFDKIKDEHYKPAMLKGIEENRKEIDAIANSEEEPTFENTIVAMDNSGQLLEKVSSVLFNLKSANTNETIDAVVTEVTPLLTKLSDDINLNEKLFKRVKAVYDKRESLELNGEQMQLLEKAYKGFVRGGANLPEEKKEQFRAVNLEIAKLTNQFGNNILAETNKYKMVIDKKEDLAGLPQSIIDGAAEAAKATGDEGKWVFTIQKPSFIPFIQYSEKRDLREKILTAYNKMGDNNDEFDNKKIAAQIAKLRVERANLLGYKTHADYILEENMAKTPAKVYELLEKVWVPAVANAKKEAAELQKLIDAEGGKFKLQPWDWWYYAEKIKKAKYALDDETLRPYFKLENVREGAFTLANKLFGIKFIERNDIPTYHEDVKVFEVTEADGKHIGLLYVDYFPRASKRGGAWMNAYRPQHRIGDKNITPIICNVCNFTKPTADKPSLLTFEEVTTLFHEFGHALHGLLSNCTYKGVTGTNVPRDFVELPSQIMENWAGEPEMLKLYAKHYKTGEVIPHELVDKITKAAKFNQGFITTEFLSAAFLDMSWHTMTEAIEQNTNEFEKAELDKIGLIPEIVVRYRSTYFRHIFGDPIGYSAGYYSYIWAGVLDADAFQAFKETSLFDKETAKKYRDNILSKGSTEDAMELYKKFRGAEPKIEPLLKRRGLM